MSLAMSEQPEFDTSRLQEVADAVRGNHSEDIANTAQKRKRDSNDQGTSADNTRRNYKRVSPNSFGSHDGFKNTNMNDPSGSSGAHMNQQEQEGVEALQDYSALHQQNSENHNGSTEHASAPSTAQAALLYPPTMTIPQPTELQFANQPNDGDRNQDSFMGDSQGENSFMDNSPGGGHGIGRPAGGSKPAVGSEEWHKVRKDNHKEGMLKTF